MVAMVATVVVHGALGGWAAATRFRTIKVKQPITIEMIDLGPRQGVGHDPMKDALAEEREKKHDELIEEEKKIATNDVMVDLPRPQVERAPQKTDYRSQYDSTVEKESVHHGKPVPIEGAAVERESDAKKPVEGAKQPQGGSGSVGALGMRSNAKPGAAEKVTGAEVGTAPVAGGELPRLGETDAGGGSARGTPGQGGDGRPPSASKDLRPSEEMIAGATAGSTDYLPDVDEGAETLLNSKRFTYASFFNRVQRAVAQNWHPNEVYQLRDPTGKIYGMKDRLTVLKVSLNPEGSLVNVVIEQASGVEFLDDEAVSAMRAAQPFPHPPRGLVDKDSNLITFRFGFYFQIVDDGPKWKVFRYLDN